MLSRSIIGLALSFFFCIFAVVDISAATLVVTKTADTADGVCDADCSLREAVAAAVPDDTILFSPLFNTPQTIRLLNGKVEINKNITITGPGSNLLSISGNNATQIFFMFYGSPSVTMSGMHLRDGRETVTGGGAMLIRDGALNLSHMVFSNNYVRIEKGPLTFGSGAAIFSSGTNMTISNSSFYANNADASLSATIIEGNEGTLDITNSSFRDNLGTGVAGSMLRAIDSTFHNNSSTGIGADNLSLLRCTVTNNRGGGVIGSNLFIDQSTINGNENIASPNDPAGGVRITGGGSGTITNTTIANNRASNNGGGIFSTGTLHIQNSSILNNEAGGSGGGIWNVIGQLFLTNSTVSGNRAAAGGGIYNQHDQTNPGGSIFLTNSTVAFNQAASLGGGILQDPNGTASLRNSIVAKNTVGSGGQDVIGAVVSHGFNLIGDTPGSSGWVATDLLDIDPLLAGLGSNGGFTITHALRLKSPALNAGSNALAVDPITKTALVTDQRGFPRVVAGAVDIGSYEGNYSSSPVSIAGRVLTPAGRGLSGAHLTLTDEVGSSRYCTTNPFGYYRFLNLPVGMTFTITASDKRFDFASPLVLTTDQNRADLNFLGIP